MSTETRLDDLLRRWEEHQRRGQPITAEELCRDCPELLEPFRRGLAALQKVDDLLGTLSPAGPDGPATESDVPAGQLDSGALTPGSVPVPGYRLEHRLGKGGFGEVWKAEGPGGFPVAMKFVRLDDAVTDFELRALEIIKCIRHPNLLATFGAWKSASYLVIAMELADRTLGDRCQEAIAQGLPGIPHDELLEYFQEAAKGIDFLNEPRHRIGGKEGVSVQHRDLKPHNILLVGNGVKVADFGLVRFLEHSVASHSGGLTPAYAAPEFFRGQTSKQSDQYCLAVTYCQLRGGRLPFSGTQAVVMLGHVQGAPDLTMLPETERPAVARALAKIPEERWPSCRAFVEALKEGAPLQQTAIEPTPPLPEPASKTTPASTHATSPRSPLKTVPVPTPSLITPSASRTSPWGVLAAVAVLLVLAAVSVVTWRTARRDGIAVIRVPQSAQPEKGAPPQGPDKPPAPLPKPLPKQVTPVPKKRDPVPPPAGPAPKPEEPVGERLAFAGHQAPVRGVAFLPDGKAAVSGGDDRMVRLWDVATRKEIRSFKGHQGPVQCVAVSSDGRYILSGGEDGTARRWEVATGREVSCFRGHTEAVDCVAFVPPDGARALSAGKYTSLRLWDVANDQEQLRFGTPERSAWSVAVSPDGRQVLTANDSPVVRVWDVETGKQTGTFEGHRDFVWSVAFAAGGRLALSGGGDQAGERDYSVRLWEVETGREVHCLRGHSAAVGGVAITTDGLRILSGSADRTVCLWDARTGKLLHRFQGHSEGVNSVAFSADGRYGLSGGRDGTARLWVLPR
jgi:WD40 repeat protein